MSDQLLLLLQARGLCTGQSRSGWARGCWSCKWTDSFSFSLFRSLSLSLSLFFLCLFPFSNLQLTKARNVEGGASLKAYLRFAVTRFNVELDLDPSNDNPKWSLGRWWASGIPLTWNRSRIIIRMAQRNPPLISSNLKVLKLETDKTHLWLPYSSRTAQYWRYSGARPASSNGNVVRRTRLKWKLIREYETLSLSLSPSDLNDLIL